MRICLIIVALAAIAVGLVHIRRAETSANHRIQQLQSEQDNLRRTLHTQQVILSRLITPKEVRRRMEDMDIRLTSRVVAPPAVTHRLAAQTPEPCE